MPQTTSQTKIYLAVISRVHAIRPRHPSTSEPMLADPTPTSPGTTNVNVDIATEHGDSSRHLLARILPEMEWMPRVPPSIIVEHDGGKPTDLDVRLAIKKAGVLPRRSSPGFGLGENVFGGPDPKPSKWTDSGWRQELTIAGTPDTSDYVAAFLITYGDPPSATEEPRSPYYQSVSYSPKVLLRIDYLLVAQQAFIPA